MALRVLDTDKPVIRRSLAESLLACLEYAGEESEAAHFGSAFHLFHAAWTLQGKAHNLDSLDADTVRRLAAEAFDAERGVKQGRRQEFMDLCQRFADTHLIDLEVLIDVERTLTHDVGWALLTCTLDRIDRTDGGDPDDEPASLRIVDRKSGVADQWGAVSHDFQVRWYTQMAFLTWPTVQVIEFELDAVRARVSPQPTVWTRGELDEWWAETLERLQFAWNERESGRTRPTGGTACQFCARRVECASAVVPWQSAPDSEEAAAEQFAELVRLTEGVAARKKALAAWFAGREPAVVGGFEVGWITARKPAFKVTGSPLGVRAYLDGVGLDGQEVLSVKPITHRAVQEHLIRAGLGEFATGEPRFDWRQHKASKEDA